MITIGLIGDYDASVAAHRAIPLALQLAADELETAVKFEWVATPEITSERRVAQFDALWCVPASPYLNMEGALLAIRFVREHDRPFLGTCGGFQHAVIEYARNVLGWADAEHAETAPEAERAVISLLECGLVEATDFIQLEPGTRVHAAYGRDEIVEGYQCRYGLNRRFVDEITSADMQITGKSPSGEVRALELTEHPFFVATLFQPERVALIGLVPPLARDFVSACVKATRS